LNSIVTPFVVLIVTPAQERLRLIYDVKNNVSSMFAKVVKRALANEFNIHYWKT